MTTYEAPKYKALGFYVGESFRRFSGGLYHTDDPAEIAVLDTLTDAVKVIAVKTEEPQVVAEVKADVIPAIKTAPKPRKASAK